MTSDDRAWAAGVGVLREGARATAMGRDSDGHEIAHIDRSGDRHG